MSDNKEVKRPDNIVISYDDVMKGDHPKPNSITLAEQRANVLKAFKERQKDKFFTLEEIDIVLKELIRKEKNKDLV